MLFLYQCQAIQDRKLKRLSVYFIIECVVAVWRRSNSVTGVGQRGVVVYSVVFTTVIGLSFSYFCMLYFMMAVFASQIFI